MRRSAETPLRRKGFETALRLRIFKFMPPLNKLLRRTKHHQSFPPLLGCSFGARIVSLRVGSGPPLRRTFGGEMFARFRAATLPHFATKSPT